MGLGRVARYARYRIKNAPTTRAVAVGDLHVMMLAKDSEDHGTLSPGCPKATDPVPFCTSILWWLPDDSLWGLLQCGVQVDVSKKRDSLRGSWWPLIPTDVQRNHPAPNVTVRPASLGFVNHAVQRSTTETRLVRNPARYEDHHCHWTGLPLKNPLGGSHAWWFFLSSHQMGLAASWTV